MTTAADGLGLLDAILADPADDAPRLVYADWLDENGQAERAEFIRLQVALAAHERVIADRLHIRSSAGCTRQFRTRNNPAFTGGFAHRPRFITAVRTTSHGGTPVALIGANGDA